MNLISFANAFLSYLIVMLVIVAVAALGFVIGRILAGKNKSVEAAPVSGTEAE